MPKIILNKVSVLEALKQCGGTATTHEVVLHLDVMSSCDREIVGKILSEYCDKIPIDTLGRKYLTGGGRARWAYKLKS